MADGLVQRVLVLNILRCHKDQQKQFSDKDKKTNNQMIHNTNKMLYNKENYPIEFQVDRSNYNHRQTFKKDKNPNMYCSCFPNDLYQKQNRFFSVETRYPNESDKPINVLLNGYKHIVPFLGLNLKLYLYKISK